MAAEHASCEQSAGVLLANMGRTTEAMFACKSSLALYLAIGHSAAAAGVMTSMAGHLSHTGQTEEALQMLQRAKALCLRCGAAEGVAAYRGPLATIASITGNVLLEAGREMEALPYAVDAAAQHERLFGRRSATTASIWRLVGACHLKLGSPATALVHFRDALEVLQALEVRAKKAGAIPELLLNIGLALVLQNQWTDALVMLERSLTLLRKRFPPDHPLIGDALRYIGVAKINAKLGRTAAAISALAAAAPFAHYSQTDCAGPGCERRLRPEGAPLDQCGGCLRTYYRGPACQRAGWKAGHKAECKALIAEAAAAADEKGRCLLRLGKM